MSAGYREGIGLMIIVNLIQFSNVDKTILLRSACTSLILLIRISDYLNISNGN